MAQGAFMEQFDNELKKVLSNIADPNTDPRKARKITLTATLKADEDRDIVNFEVQSKATLVATKPVSTKVVIDMDSNGEIVGAELLSGRKDQMFMDTDGTVKDDRGQVIDINKKVQGVNK